MTVEESINLLSTIEVNKNGEFHDIGTWYKGINKDYKEALEMAIKALEKDIEWEECINREEALSFPFANGKYDHENASEDFILGCETYKEWLEQLPSVQPKRKKGKWIEVFGYYKCSECGYDSMSSYIRFCGGCGADMRESED